MQCSYSDCSTVLDLLTTIELDGVRIAGIDLHCTIALRLIVLSWVQGTVREDDTVTCIVNDDKVLHNVGHTVLHECIATECTTHSSSNGHSVHVGQCICNLVCSRVELVLLGPQLI